jgi:hypothetical protein
MVWGPGKTTYTFSVMFRFPLPPGRLACYQQAGRVGQAETEQKYVGVSRKRIRDFTPPLMVCLRYGSDPKLTVFLDQHIYFCSLKPTCLI